MIKKQISGKVRGCKAAAFLPLLALLLLTSCKSGENVSSAKQAKQDLIGTWTMVSYKYGTGEKTDWPENVKALKLITPTHFTWVHYRSNDNTVYDSAGGTYVFDGENYTENVEFGGAGMVPYFGKSQFKIKIKDNQMILSGSLSTGLKIEEIWKKL